MPARPVGCPLLDLPHDVDREILTPTPAPTGPKVDQMFQVWSTPAADLEPQGLVRDRPDRHLAFFFFPFGASGSDTAVG